MHALLSAGRCRSWRLRIAPGNNCLRGVEGIYAAPPTGDKCMPSAPAP